MDALLSPILLYGACAIGAAGVFVCLPKRQPSPFILGAMVAAIAAGVFFIGLGARHPGGLPNVIFYLFAALALGASLRVISHPRPIYSALYFILTIIASAGLYLLLSAEFMAFALIIVYAGAILITYMFVIMLATEAPTESDEASFADYDRVSREPLVAVIAGFLLLAGLTSMLARGADRLEVSPGLVATGAQAATMKPAPFERQLRAANLLPEGWGIVRDGEGRLAIRPSLDGTGAVEIASVGGTGPERKTVAEADWPEGFGLSNTQRVGFTLIDGHPGAIEIAGVVLLMAMLGAVVLARKKVEMDEDAKREAAERMHRLGGEMGGGLGAEGPYAPPGVGETGAPA